MRRNLDFRCNFAFLAAAVSTTIAGCERAEAPGEDSARAAFVRAAEPAEPARTMEIDAVATAEARVAPEAEAIVPLAPEAAIADELDLEAEELAASAALERGDPAAAAAGFSRLLSAAFRGVAPDDRATLARWSERLASAQSRHRWSPKGAWPSVDEIVLAGDGLISVRKRAIAAHPELRVSTGLIARVNGIAGDALLQPGTRLRVPTEPVSVVVDLGARWLAYRHGAEIVAAWEVGIGRSGKETPAGNYVVGLKQRNPMWFPEGRPAVAFGDPANPLGTRWIGWLADGRETRLGFHGTNAPDQTGFAVSEGCIRMRNADVEELFDVLPEGAPILVQP